MQGTSNLNPQTHKLNKENLNPQTHWSNKEKMEEEHQNHYRKSPWLWSLGLAITKLGAKKIKGVRLNESGWDQRGFVAVV